MFSRKRSDMRPSTQVGHQPIALLNSARAWLYGNSALWRFGEEAAAETYATGSLGQGLAFPLQGYGITAGRLGAEAAGVGVVAGGAGYGVYQASQ